jgi:hypothetical protein
VQQLPSLFCPSCRKTIAAAEFDGRAPTATQFGSCLRQCQTCQIGASNAANPYDVTFIHQDTPKNIPEESREGAREALSQSLNVRARKSKWDRFGFDTSEDAVTWVVFTHLLRSGQLLGTLGRAGLIVKGISTTAPALLLWGVPVGDNALGAEIRRQLCDLCVSLGEDRNSFSEPDVIIDFGNDGLMFIEVKYRSGNDSKPVDYRGWSKYGSTAVLAWRFEDVKASGCYELMRNWWAWAA